MTDAVVVGGGVAGLSVARELARRGVHVALVERGTVGAEASWAAAGMLAPQVEADGRDEFFDFACESRDAYPAFADALLEETGIDIELDCTGTLYLAFTEEDERECERRFAWQQRAGLIIERLSADEARTHEPNLSPRVRAALRFARAWQVENRRLCAALARSAQLGGVKILERTEARSIITTRGRVAAVETSRGRIEAGAVVVACGAWSSLLPFVEDGSNTQTPNAQTPTSADASLTETRDANAPRTPRIEPVRGQMLCFASAADAPLVRHVVYSPSGYVVPRRDGRLLAGTTVERVGFDKSVTEEGRRAIRSHAEEIAPAVADLKLIDEWAGLRPRASDDLPVLGASAEIENLFYATGHYRNGILLAPLTGMLIAELITTGETPAPLAPFSPARFPCAVTHAV
ncbi:MAG: glycine oxidase [Acidobacteriota bacterium]|jgi:glycine oxidase|nr:glycine oxidase [Acidobacteriota bacterium]